jgi:sodium/potassium-transporting ATPase subunit alpha
VASTEKIRSWDEQTLDHEALQDRLETKIKKTDGGSGYQGLSDEDALKKLHLFGPNVLSEKKTLPWPIKLLLEFTGLFNYLLWAGAILCFIGFGLQADKSDKSSLYLGIIIIVVILITGIFAFA